MSRSHALIWGGISGWVLGYLMLLASLSVGGILPVGSFAHRVLLILHRPILDLEDRLYSRSGLLAVVLNIVYWVFIGAMVGLSLSPLRRWRRRVTFVT